MKLTTLWDDRYNTIASGSILSTRKQRDVMAGASAEGLLDVVAPDVDVAFAWRMIAEVHQRSYVDGNLRRRFLKAPGIAYVGRTLFARDPLADCSSLKLICWLSSRRP
jgi:hypothetical protein